MPCRICTANDEDALIEDLAQAMWESTRDMDTRMEVYQPWDEASEHWRERFRCWAKSMATVARDSLVADSEV